jgi:hypothetical protein
MPLMLHTPLHLSAVLLLAMVTASCGQPFPPPIKPPPPPGKTLSAPSLKAGLEAVRQLNRSGPLPEGGVVVRLPGGVESLIQPLDFTAADSGTAESPVRYETAPGQPLILTAAAKIRPGDCRSVTRPEALARLPQGARSAVRQVDLKQLGIPPFKKPPNKYTDGGGLPGLFSHGTRLTPARWPNAGDTTMDRVLDKGDSKRPAGQRGGTYTYRENRIERWANAAREGRLWAAGYWRVAWAHETIRVQTLDPAKKSITHTEAADGGLGSKYAGPEGAGNEPWHVTHLMEELDQPGEWCLDFSTQTLYFWPPASAGDAGLSLTWQKDPAISFRDASHLTLRGLTIEGTLGDAVSITGGSRVTLAGCTVRQTGGNGVVVSGGTGHQVISCDLYEMGAGGIILSGGDRRTLTPAGHHAHNNHISGIGRTTKVYAPGIMVGFYEKAPATGCVVSHNRIHDTPHGGVLYGGNDNLFEYNEIYDIVKESDDMGAFYTSHDWSSYGNIVRYNFIHHAPRATGCYADDGDSGDHWEGNVFYRTICGPFIGGGHDNVAVNNLVIFSGRGAHLDQRGLARGYGTEAKLFKQLTDMAVEREPWSTRFPSLKSLAGDNAALPRGNVIEHTVAVACESVLHFGGKPAEFSRCRIENNHELSAADMGFVNPAALDFRIRPGAAVFDKVPGFTAPPFGKMGLVVDELRPSLPERDPGFSKGLIPDTSGKGTFTSTLTLESPSNKQVVPLSASGQAATAFRGSVSELVETVRYRLTGQPRRGEFPDRWTVVPLDRRRLRFDSALSLPEGGPYRLEVQALAGTQILAEWKIDQFRAGPPP